MRGPQIAVSTMTELTASTDTLSSGRASRGRRRSSSASANKSGGFLTFATSLALNLLALALPLTVLEVYDSVIADQAVATLEALGLGLVVIVGLEFILRTAQSAVLTIDAQRAGHRRFAAAVDHELAGSQLARDGMSAERRMERFRALDAYSDYLGGDRRRHLIDLPFSLVFLGALAMIGGWLVLAPLTIALIAALVGRSLLRRVRQAAQAREESAERNAEFLAEILSAMHVVKGVGAEAPFARRQERLSAGAGALFRDNSLATSDIQTASSALTALGAVTTIAFGAALAIQGAISIGALAACSMLSARALQPILRGLAALAERQGALVSASLAEPLFAGPAPARREVADTGPSMPAAVALAGAALLDDHGLVLFEEATLAPPVGGLTLVSADNPDDGVALMRVIAGVVDPHEGRALIDGRDAAAARGAIGEIALVTPTTRLFSGSIIENLTHFGAGADSDAALRVARMLGLDKAVNMLPEGYATRVGDAEFDMLSRSSIAQLVLTRAVAQRPRLLLLDDPAYELDAEARRRLIELIADLRGRTTIIAQPRGDMLDALADARIAIGGGLASLRRASKPRAAHDPSSAAQRPPRAPKKKPRI